MGGPISNKSVYAIRPMLFELMAVFAAGYCVGKYTNINIPTIAELKEITAQSPDEDPEIVSGRKPFITYSPNGDVTFNFRKRGKR